VDGPALAATHQIYTDENQHLAKMRVAGSESPRLPSSLTQTDSLAEEGLTSYAVASPIRNSLLTSSSFVFNALSSL
jgi:hypothetical protein